jgi:hypothetical protein
VKFGNLRSHYEITISYTVVTQMMMHQMSVCSLSLLLLTQNRTEGLGVSGTDFE